MFDEKSKIHKLAMALLNSKKEKVQSGELDLIKAVIKDLDDAANLNQVKKALKDYFVGQKKKLKAAK